MSLPPPRPTRQPKPPPPRQVRVFDHADGDGLTIVEVTENGHRVDYSVARLPSQWGIAFR
jgi:hypothetical protein